MQPMSDTRHLSDLKFEERPLSQNPQQASEVSQIPQTDMVMLQKADAWMSQFKTRLNISIIALVVLWGTISYFKSTGMQFSARAPAEPERILADGSGDGHAVPTVEVDSLQRDVPVETVEAVATEKVVEVETAEIKPVTPVVKEAPAVKAAPSPKKPAASKAAKAQKKLKKSVAAKAAGR